MLRLILAALVLHLVLAVPNYPDGMTPAAFARFQLELPAILLALMLLPPKWWVRGILASILCVILILKTADIATFSAFNRPFNFVIDLHLVGAGLDLLGQSIGKLQAWGAILAALAVLALTFAALLWTARQWGAVSLGMSGRVAGGAVAAVFALLAVADTGRMTRDWAVPVNPPGSAVSTRVAYWHAKKTYRAGIELAEFQSAATQDPYADRTDLLDLTGDRDVVLIYVESYGRASFDNPLYAPTHVATLRAAQADLADRGLGMRSAWLRSPVAGGQSWLAHATLSSGLEIGDQARYAAVLASPRRTLFHLAQDAGFRTAAVMPAITIAWPEVELMGFDAVLPAADLGYRGKPYNWVTMPDQYTLSAFDALLPPDPRPDFVQIALISSHAPWVPVPQMVDWDTLGDGQVLDQWADAGDPPKVVWRDRDRVRDQYRQAVDYALQAVTEFAARQDDPPIMIVVGDHPAAGFVSQIDGRHVPVHIIAPPDILARVAAWYWTTGLIPAADAPVWPMASFRDRFIAAFTSANGRPEIGPET